MSVNVRKTKAPIVMKNPTVRNIFKAFQCPHGDISAPFCPSQRCDKPEVPLSPGAKWGMWEDAALIFRSGKEKKQPCCFFSHSW